jgi:DNA-directed RNA polymerase subunit omega
MVHRPVSHKPVGVALEEIIDDHLHFKRINPLDDEE